jgi:hypothetical protein
MKLLAIALLIAVPAFAGVPSFIVTGTDAAPWGKIFGALGIGSADAVRASIVVLGGNATMDVTALSADHIVVLEGTGTAAHSLGFIGKSGDISVRQICDIHAPKMQIIWEQPASLASVTIPDGFQVFATEKWKGVPVLAGKRTSHGAILWVAASPGTAGYERYPYLLNALVDLGLELPLRTTNLWAFFDSSYRLRADVDYLAKRWRQAGISALHVAAWHNADPDPAQDAYLKKLIEACHRNSILVYAWLELPHVSEKFWADHPVWREKTALGQDAQLDWRKLMNLQNPDCHREVARQISSLLNRFDWDGVNLAELYFESLEGVSNPARFTPMNDDVRAEFKEISGFDPKLLFDPSSQYAVAKNPTALRKFLDFRAVLASRLQSDWLKEIDVIKTAKPYLDIVVTHIDDRFDPAIRDELGADVAHNLPSIQAHRSTLLVEDPANLWNLGADRYSKIAEKYRILAPDNNRIAVDINIVERYQDVYPTKKQTGIELLELVHQAASSFSHVALYFENSIEKQDLTLLPVAAANATEIEHGPDELDIKSTSQTRVAWEGPVEIDGTIWPVQNEHFVLIPAGKHRLSPGLHCAPVTLSDFNGDIQSALISENRVDLSYISRGRAFATLASPVSSIEVDGAPFWKPAPGSAETTITLPAGQHLVSFNR